MTLILEKVVTYSEIFLFDASLDLINIDYL